MLSDSSAAIVRETLPVIGAAIDDITTVFYRRMFDAHPHLEHDLFNRGNQAQGDQQRALAGAIATYATLLVTPGAPPPDALLSRIGNKHASLGITEDQYLIVEKYLFAAIVEILGDAVTPEVAAAWTEVYWLMANSLIAVEKSLYTAADVAPGDVWRTVVVRDRVQQSADTVAYLLANPQGAPLPQFLPGQYISVAAAMPDGARQIRQYSLSRASRRDEWRITVKVVTAGAGPAGEVSNHLHANIFEGDELEVSHPFGDLTLDEQPTPLLLVSAGIGCTPMVGMLDHLVRTNSTRDVAVVHADRSPATHAHRKELQDLVDRMPTATLHRWYESLGTRTDSPTTKLGRADLSGLEVAPDTLAYLCGPLPFMEAMRESLIARGLPAANIRYEVFGPDKWLEAV